jgi:Holliday junction resolvase RusA-like endonuclease
VKLAAQHAGVELVERVKVDIAICLPMNVKHFKTKPDVYSEPLVRPDRDNVSKSIGDALQGILVRDDKHILDGRSYYVWLRNPNAQPKTIITITEVDWKDYIEIERKDGAE